MLNGTLPASTVHVHVRHVIVRVSLTSYFKALVCNFPELSAYYLHLSIPISETISRSIIAIHTVGYMSNVMHDY